MSESAPSTDPWRQYLHFLDVYHDDTRHSETTVPHSVRPADTLVGLCLLYDASARKLKKANSMTGDCIAHLAELTIPVSCGLTPEELVTKFRHRTKEDKQEAILYLEDSGYDLELGKRALT